MQLRDDAVIAGYDDVWRPFAETSKEAGQRTYAAIVTDMVHPRNKRKRVTLGANRSDTASIAYESHRQACR